MRTLSATAAIAALFLTSGASIRTPSQAELALPWLHGLPAGSVAGAFSREAEAWLQAWRSPHEDCTTTSDTGFALIADLAPAPGLETVLASYTSGVVVLDAAGHQVASTPPLQCLGSADAIEGIVVGELLPGEPAIALAATSGGRAERTTWLYFFALRGEALVPIFSAPVEEWHGPTASTGEVARLPGGELRYRSPAGELSRWTYDREAGRFVMREVIRPAPPTPSSAPAA